MKIRYIALTLLLAISLTITAAERSLQMKRHIATTVLKGTLNRHITLHGTLKEMKTMAGLTVMGYDEGGFVIISNDDRNAEVLAWSDNRFDEAGMPDGLKWWLAATDEILSSGMAYTAATDINASLPAEVQPMLRTTWGQGAPYNLLCPNNYPSGCVATAMAQIMYYYKYPTHGKGSVWDSGNLMFVDFGSATYAYDDMLESYAGEYTTTAGNAVATLMYHCGASVGMKYSANASGAYTYKVPTALRENFMFHKNVSYRGRDFHSNADWMNMVYTELAAGRPVLYAASDENGTGGHAFIFDGYNAEGLVHVNWGWDSSADGYYDMSILDPSVDKTQYRYSTGQNMVTGAGLPDADIPHRSEIVCRDGIAASISGEDITIKVNGTVYYNLNDYVFSGDLHVMLDGASGSHKLYSISFADKDMQMETMSGAGFKVDLNVKLPAGLADGTYTLYIGAQDTGFSEITPVSYSEGKTSRYILTKKGSDITLTADTGMSSGIKQIIDVELEHGNMVFVYDAGGRMVYKSAASDFSIDAVPATGLLIIKSGNTVKKTVK